MKIYKSKSGGFWFAQTKENGWFCFSSTLPDINTLNLCPGMFGNQEEQTAWDEGVDISKDVEVNVFNKFARMTNNYKDLCDFIKTYYPNTTQNELDEQYNYHPELVRLTDEIIEKSKNNIISDYQYEEIYRDVRNHMNTWNDDIERVKKFVIEHDIPNIKMFNNTMVDVFGECHPTKHFLLHEFYNHWGEKLDELIDKAIELYPDNKDFDKAYYYVKDKLNELHIKHIEDLKKRYKKQ